MKLKMITEPTELPITLEEAKAFYRVLGTEEDAVITRTITAAKEKAEQITNRQLVKATYEGYLDSFPLSVTLPKPPLVSVQKVEYINAKGETKTFTNYTVDDVSVPAVINFRDTPSDIMTDGVNNVIITFECGYDTVPAAIASWIQIFGATLFEQRENMVIGASVSDEPKRYFDHLLDSYRIIPV